MESHFGGEKDLLRLANAAMRLHQLHPHREEKHLKASKMIDNAASYEKIC